jgi:hypothetical protein
MLRSRALLFAATTVAALTGFTAPAHATDSVSATASYNAVGVGTGLVLVTTCTATGSAGAVITSVDCTVNGSTITGTAPGGTAVVVRPDAVGGTSVTICVQGHATFYPNLNTVSSSRRCTTGLI